MIQMNRVLGYRATNLSSVSDVYTVPSSRSMAVTLIGVRLACAFADAMRAGKGAMSDLGFNGLPGETIHQYSSSPSESIANRLIARCPPCAGLKDPPMRPTVFKGVTLFKGETLFKGVSGPARGQSIYRL